MKLTILQRFNLKTATALLAGAAYDFDHPYNAPLECSLPDEAKIRLEILDCARRILGLTEDDENDASIRKISDLLNSELEQMMLMEKQVQPG